MIYVKCMACYICEVYDMCDICEVYDMLYM